MNFFWIIALVNGAYIALVLFTGRIRLRGYPLVDRDLNCSRYWTFVGAFGIVEVALIVMAMLRNS